MFMVATDCAICINLFKAKPTSKHSNDSAHQKPSRNLCAVRHPCIPLTSAQCKHCLPVMPAGTLQPHRGHLQAEAAGGLGHSAGP